MNCSGRPMRGRCRLKRPSALCRGDARSVLVRAAECCPGISMRFGSGTASDDGSGPDSTWNLGDLVHDREQAVELIGGYRRIHFDRVADACRRPSAGVELACRGHANAVQLDAQGGGFPVNVIEYAAGCREVGQDARQRNQLPP